MGAGGIQSGGDMGVEGDITINGDLTITGSCTGCSSDLALKEGIKPLNGALEGITSLQGISFYWGDKAVREKKAYPGRQIGVIAQEVEKVFPEIVGYDSRGYKYVDYQKLVVPLIEVRRAQQAKIDRLKEEIAALKELISSASLTKESY